MLQLDHITVITPSLAEGVAHVRSCLGIDVPFGRAHPDMGTHNHLLRLGESVYLEIIAVNADAPRPDRARWFGLDDQADVRADWDSGRRLRGWVARTNDIDAVLAGHETVLGRKVAFTSANGSFCFAIPEDGSLPLEGAAPSVIDRLGKPPSVAAMADAGARLQSVMLEHPEPARVIALYRSLGIADPPVVVSGERLRYRALIKTPNGLRELT
ncbi:VOC family protein [Ferrovibrio terrae]|uniref:VOC family protein n=1 Tax=Ferrovibrio terrae TaxID=2594003 RepID=A0A516GYY2_9PROT|nr:VOC family protein [Ferrovibrio terrae]QDO96726.1 VOC family protein [Ferrovibrio terrae]